MYASSRSEALNTIVRRRIFAGNYFLMKQYRQKYFERALKVRRIIHDELRQAFREVDLIVTPTASGTAPKYSELRDTLFSKEDNDDYFTQAANLAGIPSISVPVGVAEDGLPIGVQLMADKLQDRAVCDVAHILDGLIRK
ncbi:Amidase domain-containing protein [Caenorhabditis elegans]|nr:Amidase domain-containing protein [Caenorhabditis elegans]CDH93345.1 Amidase domain-containing protein [Caenorhabditis elegans]|eukprot:NP_001294546.1 Glutamyl-tRNA(Gln) amidotransferase subunit A, mitochondrial [Caenorhabditis elegans]